MDNHYELLDLPNYSDFDLVKSRYQEFAKEYHPDKLVCKESCLTKEESTLFFVNINKAWKVLKDPCQKAAYDEQLKQYESEKTYTVNDSASIDDFEVAHLDGKTIFTYQCRCGGDYQLLKTDFVDDNESIICGCSNCSLCIEVFLHSWHVGMFLLFSKKVCIRAYFWSTVSELFYYYCTILKFYELLLACLLQLI